MGRTAPLPPPSTLAQPLEGDLGDLAAAEATAAAAGSGAAAGSQQGWTAHDEAVLRHFLATTRDQMKLVSSFLGMLRWPKYSELN